MLSWLTRLPLTVTYQVVCAASAVSVIVLASAALLKLGVRGWSLRVCISLVVLNPYAIRFYALAPGYVADVIFQVGLAASVLAIVSRRYGLLLAGVSIAVLARQTILPAAVILALWMLIDGRRRPGAGTRLALAGALVAVPVLLLLGVRFSPGISRSATRRGSPKTRCCRC